MNKSAKLILLSSGLLTASLLLQSTVFKYIAIFGVKPDLSLVILVFISLRGGRTVGQVSGFTAGILEDFLSFPPLGFHALIRTIIGFLFGIFQGAIYIDALFMPVVFVLIASLLKGSFSWLLSIILSMGSTGGWGAKFWIEVAYNSILTPFLFALLNLLKMYRLAAEEKRGV